jgi:hypothetical protein
MEEIVNCASLLDILLVLLTVLGFVLSLSFDHGYDLLRS